MIIRNFFSGILLAVGCLACIPAFAAGSDNTPIELGLFPPLQIPNTDFGVKGLRLTLVGYNREMHGIDLGLIGNMTDVDFQGLAISSLFNYNHGGSSVIGLQLAGIANLNPGHSAVYGMQLALYNSAGTVYGLQLGLINVATELHGIQIGLVNVNKNGPFHVTPIINVAF